MSEDKPKPGEARAKGPNIADVISSDAITGPTPLLESEYNYLGDEDISVERYTSREYFDLEMKQLWPRAWQWACREEHIQDEGDNYVYDIGDYSVVVVRVDTDTIKAYLNVCTHRGTRLLGAQGSGFNTSFTCPFHGWSWHLDGSIKNIPGRWDFPHVCEEKHGLQEIQCERWGGFVFINFDLDAKPLTEYLDVLPEHFRHFPLERRRIKLHVEKILPCNWKAGQEAFMEAYHNFETHGSPTGANTQYDIFGKFVSRFIHNIGSYSAESLSDYPGKKWRDPVMSEQEILATMAVENRTLETGETARRVAAESMRISMGRDLGVDFSNTSDSLMLDSIEYHLFPNMFFFAGISIPMVYRFRPQENDIDSCIFDLMILEPLAKGAEHPEPPEPEKLDIEQSYTEVEALSWLGAIFDQDTSNLQLQQQGFKTLRKGLTLGNYQESRIRRVHMTLNEFMLTDEKNVSVEIDNE
jgi:phenylpropionate dioxygenase-like ring-hydroxylating dioxygenase large terminal subunit